MSTETTTTDPGTDDPVLPEQNTTGEGDLKPEEWHATGTGDLKPEEWHATGENP